MRGLAIGEIGEHFAEIHGASVSRNAVSRIADGMLEDMPACWSRPLQRVHPAVFIDA